MLSLKILVSLVEGGKIKKRNELSKLHSHHHLTEEGKKSLEIFYSSITWESEVVSGSRLNG